VLDDASSAEPATALAVARDHDTVALAGALIASLCLDGRDEEAWQIIASFTSAKIGTGGNVDDRDVALAEALARKHGTRILSRALIVRLTLDGRHREAWVYDIVFTAHRIGTSEPNRGDAN
jgi:hypothetical protein